MTSIRCSTSGSRRFLFATTIKRAVRGKASPRPAGSSSKNLGHDLASARALAEDLHQYVDESQLYRIDHYLGKMGLEEILYLRFANTMLEPVWEIGTTSSAYRSRWRKASGLKIVATSTTLSVALRDVVVNHLHAGA